MSSTKLKFTAAVLIAVGLSCTGPVTVADRVHAGNQPAKPKTAPAKNTRTMVSPKEPVSIESPYPVWEIVCSQDGMRLAITGLARQDGVGTGTIRVLDIPTARERFHLKDQNFPPRFAFAPDGKTIAVITAVSHSQGHVHLWSVGTGKRIRTLESDTIHGGLVFSPDSKTLISVGVDQKQSGRITLWESATGKERAHFKLPGAKKGFGFFHCVLSPDGTKLAVHDTSLEIYGAGRTIKDRGDSSLGIWETETGEALTKIKEHRFGFADFVFDPNSLAVTSDRQTLVTLGCVSIAFCQPQANVQIQGARLIDGQWHAGENPIVLRNANTGKEIRRFAEKRPESLVFRHIAMSMDGKTLAGGGSDGVIYLWDVATGKEIQQLKNHQRDLAQKDGWTLGGIVLAFTPDGRRLVSAANKRVLIWNMQDAVK